MALTAANVLVGVSGSVKTAVTGTTLPTTIAGALDAAFHDLGYISEEGVTESNSVETTDIKGWQNGAVVRTIQTGHSYTLKFKMLETNQYSLTTFYNDYTAGAIEVTGGQGWRGCLVLDVLDGADPQRIVIPDGQVTEFGDVVYQNGDAIGYEVTVTCFPDTGGVKAYKYVTT